MKEEEKIDWDEIEKEGRGKILWLEKQELLNIFVSAQMDLNVHTLIDLPVNWRVYSVFYEPERRAFGFIILSDEFPAISTGAKLPELEQEKVKTVVGHMTIKT